MSAIFKFYLRRINFHPGLITRLLKFLIIEKCESTATNFYKDVEFSSDEIFLFQLA